MFRRKKRILKEDFDFLNAVVSKLPSKYGYLKRQVNAEFLLGKELNKLSGKGNYTLIFDANLAKKYTNKKIPRFFIIKDIKIFNRKDNLYEDIELDIVTGLLSGFKINTKYRNLDFNTIDSSHIKEKHFEDKNGGTLTKILGKIDEDIISQLDIDETFEIKIPEGEFYVIKNLGDGNYLSINKQGAVYGMIHDPYEVELLFEKKDDFFKALKNGTFKIQEYYRKKFRN